MFDAVGNLYGTTQAAGTTGYEALAAVDRLFTDPAGEATLDELDTQLRGGLRVDWPVLIRSTAATHAAHVCRVHWAGLVISGCPAASHRPVLASVVR